MSLTCKHNLIINRILKARVITGVCPTAGRFIALRLSPCRRRLTKGVVQCSVVRLPARSTERTEEASVFTAVYVIQSQDVTKLKRCLFSRETKT